MMIEINLLPDDLRKKEPRAKKAELSGMGLQGISGMNKLAMVVGALVILQIILVLFELYSKARLNALTAKYNAILPKKKESDTLREDSRIISRKAAAIDELMVKRFSWVKKLNALSDSVTPGIWLSGLSYEEKAIDRPFSAPAVANAKVKSPQRASLEKALSKYLILTGYASKKGEEGTALVGKFIKALKDNGDFYSDFDDIELGSIKSEQIEGQEVMYFKITCLLK